MSAPRRVPGRSRAVEVGERVFLRLVRASDADELRALVRASRRFLKPWFPVRPRGEKLFDPATMRSLVKRTREGRFVPLAICSLADGSILGRVSLNEIVRGPFQSAFLGYWIGAPHARQGFMSEALELTLCQAFVAQELHRVEANLMPRNEASRAVVRRAGFRYEGISPDYLKIAGVWEAHEHWALTEPEWRAARGRR